MAYKNEKDLTGLKQATEIKREKLAKDRLTSVTGTGAGATPAIPKTTTGARSSGSGSRALSMDQATYDRYDQAYQAWQNNGGKYSAEDAAWIKQQGADPLATWRKIRNSGGALLGEDKVYRALDADTYDAYDKAYGEWERTGKYSDDFASIYDQGDRDLYLQMRQARNPSPVAGIGTGDWMSSLDPEVLEAVKSAYRDSWVYDPLDPEDIARQQAGQPPKNRDKYYGKSDLDQWLYSQGLPSTKSNYFQQQYQKAQNKINAERAEWAQQPWYDFESMENGEAIRTELSDYFRSTWKYSNTPEDRERQKNGQPPASVAKKYTKSPQDQYYLEHGLPPASEIGMYAEDYDNYQTSRGNLLTDYINARIKDPYTDPRKIFDALIQGDKDGRYRTALGHMEGEKKDLTEMEGGDLLSAYLGEGKKKDDPWSFTFEDLENAYGDFYEQQVGVRPGERTGTVYDFITGSTGEGWGNKTYDFMKDADTADYDDLMARLDAIDGITAEIGPMDRRTWADSEKAKGVQYAGKKELEEGYEAYLEEFGKSAQGKTYAKLQEQRKALVDGPAGRAADEAMKQQEEELQSAMDQKLLSVRSTLITDPALRAQFLNGQVTDEADTQIRIGAMETAQRLLIESQNADRNNGTNPNRERGAKVSARTGELVPSIYQELIASGMPQSKALAEAQARAREQAEKEIPAAESNTMSDKKAADLGYSLYRDLMVSDAHSWTSPMEETQLFAWIPEDKLVEFVRVAQEDGAVAAGRYWADELRPEAEAAMREWEELHTKEYALAHPGMATAKAIAMTIPTGIMGIEQTIAALTGDYRENDWRGTMGREKTQIQQYVADRISKSAGEGWAFLYNTGISMAESLQTMALGDAGLILTGFRVSGSKVDELIDKGIDSRTAGWYGLVAGATEALTEKASIDHLYELKNNGQLVDFLKQALWSQGMAEGSEEVVSEIVDIIGEWSLPEDKSQFKQIVAQLEAQGMSHGEAVTSAILNNAAPQVAMAFAGGYVSGALFGFGGQIIQGGNAAKSSGYSWFQFEKGNQILSQYEQALEEGGRLFSEDMKGVYRDLSTSGLSAETISFGAELFQQAAQTPQVFATPNAAAAVAKMFEAVKQAGMNNRIWNAETQEKRVKAQNRLTTMLEAVQSLYAQSQQALNDGNLLAHTKFLNDLNGKMGEYTRAYAEAEAAMQTDQAKTEQRQAEQESTVRGAMDEAQVEITASADNTVKSIMGEEAVDAIRSGAVDADTVMQGGTEQTTTESVEEQTPGTEAATETAEEQTAETEAETETDAAAEAEGEAPGSNVNKQARIETEADKATGENEAQRQLREEYEAQMEELEGAMRDAVDDGDMETQAALDEEMSEATDEFEQAYEEAGRETDTEAAAETETETETETEAEAEAEPEQRNTLPKAENGGSILDAIMKDALNHRSEITAEAEAREQTEIRQAEQTQLANAQPGVYVQGINTQTLTENQRRDIGILENLGKRSGTKFVLHDTIADEGGTVVNGYYDPATDTVHINANAVGDGMLFYAGHEVTHRLRKRSAGDYKTLSDSVMRYMNLSEDALTSRISDLQDRYRQAGHPLSREDAIEEIIANAVPAAFADQGFVNDLANENRGLFHRIRNWLHRIADQISKAVQGEAERGGYEDAEKLMQNAQAVRDMAANFDRALRNMGERTTQRKAPSNVSTLDTMVPVTDTATGGEQMAASLADRELMEIKNGHPVGSEYVQDTKDGSLKFNFRTMKRDEDGYMEDLKRAAREGKLADFGMKEIEELRTTVDRIMDRVLQNREILDFEEDTKKRAWSPYKPNGDPHYKMALDFSTLCRKRVLTQAITERLQVMLGRSLTPEESVAIRYKLLEMQKIDKKIQVACALCYVESARMRSPKVINQFLDDIPGSIQRWYAKGDSNAKLEIQIRRQKLGTMRQYWKTDENGEPIPPANPEKPKKSELNKEGQEAWLRINDEVWEKHKAPDELIERAKQIPREQFLTAKGLADLSVADPISHDIYMAFANKVTAAARSKSLQTDVAYDRGDINSVGQAIIDEMNRESGFRHQSWSDFETKHILDLIGSIIELSTRGAKMHAYTKVADMAYVVGKTGMMLNLSLIPKGQTGLENGRLVWDPTEGMAWEVAKVLRNQFPDTVGNIAIGISDDQIRALMASDDIDYIIPYHESGLKKSMRKLMDLQGWNTFTSTQNEKRVKNRQPSQAESENKWVAPKLLDWFNEAAAAEAEDGRAFMVEASKEYIRLCNERCLIPKFSEFLTQNSDGTFSLPEDGSADGYWKLLIDRKMVNQKTGKIIIQKPVRPIFDYDMIRTIMDREVYDPVHANDERVANDVISEIMNGGLQIKDEYRREVARNFMRDIDSVMGERSNAQRYIDEITNGQGLADYLRNDETKFSLAPGEEKTIYIKDGTNTDTGETVSFTDLILDGVKKGETRSMNTNLAHDQWIGIAKDGQVVGRVYLGAPITIDKSSPEYADAMIEGTEYDIKDGESKKYYPILDYEDWRDDPRPIKRNGNYGVYQRDGEQKYSLGSRVTPEQDAAYRDAVNRGDMETAQRMVDEAAEDAGYNRKGYHQTSAERFRVFNTEHEGAGKYDDGLPTGFFVKPTDKEIGVEGNNQMALYFRADNPLVFRDRDEAHRYWMEHVPGYREAYERRDALDQQRNQEYEDLDKQFDAIYAKAYETNDWTEYEEFDQKESDFLEQWNEEMNPLRRAAKDLITTFMRSSEFDSIHLLKDKGGIGKGTIETWVLFNPNQLKSADPVTYHPDGTPVDLSERFNRAENDINYSLGERTPAQQQARINQLEGMVNRREQWLRDYKAKAAERQKEIRQRNDVQALRKNVIKRAKELNDWLQRPTKEKHVPIPIQTNVAGILQQLDISISKRGSMDARKFRESVRGLKDFYVDYLAGVEDKYDFDFDGTAAQGIVQALNNLEQSLKDTPNIGELNRDQLKDLVHILGQTRAAVKITNRMLSNQRYATVDAVGQQTQEDSNNRKEKKIWRGFEGAQNLIEFKTMDAFSWAKAGGTGAESVISGIEKGFQKAYGKVKEGVEFYDGVKEALGIKAGDLNRWDKDAVNVTLESGNTARFTTMQIMELYALSKREQARYHLLTGGIELKDMKNGPRQTDVFYLTENDLQSITSRLTQQQKDYIDALQTFLSTDAADWGNEPWVAKYGYENFGEENYWPIKSAARGVKTQDPEAAQMQNAMLNMGITKALTPNANNPVTLGNADDTFIGHVAQMANMNGLALPIDDALKWFNWIGRNEDGTRDWQHTTKSALEKMMGPEGTRYFVQLLKDVNGLSTGNMGTQFASQLMSKYKRAAVAGKLRVVVQQPTAVLRSFAMIDPKYFANSYVGNIKSNIKEMQEHSPLAWWKAQGNYDIGTGRSLKSIFNGTDNLIDTITDKAMTPAGWADDFAWGWLWSAVKNEIADKRTDLTPGTDEYWEAVNDRFSDIVNQTQVVDGVLQRSEIMRSKNGLDQMASAFMAEPIKSYNLIRNRLMDVIRGGGREARKALFRALIAFGLSVAVNSAVLAAHDALKRRKKGDPFSTAFSDNFRTNALDDVKPWNYVPYIKDIAAIMQGDSVDRMDMSMVSDVYKAINNGYKYMKGDSSYTGYKVGSDILKVAGAMAGVPTTGLIATMETIVNGIHPGAIKTKQYLNKENRAALKEAGISYDDAYGIAAQYKAHSWADKSASTNAEKAVYLLKAADTIGASYTDEQFDILSEVMGMNVTSYDPKKDGHFGSWARKTVNKYVADKKKKGGLTDEVKERYEGYGDILSELGY